MRTARALPVVLLGAAGLAVLALLGVTDLASLQAALGLGGPATVPAPESLGSADEADVASEVPALAAAGRRPSHPDATMRGGADDGDAARAPVPIVALEGVVLRADGRPAVGARVELVGPDGVRHGVLADAEGRFRAEVAPGRYDVLVRAGFDGWAFLADVWVDGRPLANALELSTAVTVRVEAQLDGQALSGAPARLRWTPPAGGAPRGVADGVTDRDGVLEAEGMPPGTYVVEVDAAPGLTGVRSLEIHANATVPVRFPALGRWTGRVVDAVDRTPLPASVTLTVNVEGGYARGAVVADARGVFEVVVPRGVPRHVLVEHEGHVPFPAERREAQPTLAALGALRRDDVLHDVELRRGLSLAGVVRLADTLEPVEGVALDVVPQDGRVAAELGAAPRRVTSGPDGAYEVRGVFPGTWVATVASEGWYPDGEAKVRISATTPGGGSGGAIPRLDVRVRGAGRIVGRVVRDGGLPVAGARVWLVGGGGVVRAARAGGRPLEALTGPEGGFVLLDVPPATPVRVRAALGDLEAVPSPSFRLLDGAPPAIVLTLSATGAIGGRVADLETRDPVAGARVRLEAVGEPGGRGTRTTTSDAEGRYEVKGLIPGEWKATPEKRGAYLPSTGATTRLEPGTARVDLPLLLDPGLSVSGVVVDGAGARVANARLTLSGTEDGTDAGPAKPGGVRQVGRSGADGAFRFVALRPGAYALEARFGPARGRVDHLRGGERAVVVTLTR